MLVNKQTNIITPSEAATYLTVRTERCSQDGSRQ